MFNVADVRRVENHIGRHKGVPIIIVDHNNDDYLSEIQYRCRCDRLVKIKPLLGYPISIGDAVCPICEGKRRMVFMNIVMN